MFILTNGEYYITYAHPGEPKEHPDHNQLGAIKKVKNKDKAYKFLTREDAKKEKERASGSLRSYKIVSLDKPKAVVKQIKQVPKKEPKVPKKEPKVSKSAKDSSDNMTTKRLKIYLKTDGRCYICGERVDINSFQIEHKIPSSRGGTNEISNLFCSCPRCNSIKRDLTYDELIEWVNKIYNVNHDLNYEGKHLKK